MRDITHAACQPPDESLSMAGSIISQQKCRDCGQRYKLGVYQNRPALVCACGHPATRHTIRLKWKGQDLWISKDRQGRPLANYAQAQREIEGIRLEIDRHTFDPSFYKPSKLRPLLAENFFPGWLAYEQGRLKRGQLAPETCRARQLYVRRWIDHLQGRDIRDLRYGDLEDLRDRLLDELAPKTVWNTLRDLQTCLRWAKRRGDLRELPEFPEVKFDRPTVRWIDEATQTRIIEAIPEPDRPIFIFLATYGRRPGEARALKWDSVDLDQKTITIRRTFSGRVLKEATKAHTVSVLPMIEHIEQLLRGLPRSLSGFVFINRLGRPYAHPERIWRQACNQAGVDISLYQGTRHSFGARKVAEGHSLELIGEVMGHTDPQTTKRYVGSDSGRLVKVVSGKVTHLLLTNFKMSTT